MKERSPFTQFSKEASDFKNVIGGVSQGSILGPIAFVVKINTLASDVKHVLTQEVYDDVVVDNQTIIFKDDTTSWEALDIHDHISGTEIGNITKKIDVV